MVYVLSGPVSLWACLRLVHAIKMKIRAARGRSQDRRSSTGPARDTLRKLGSLSVYRLPDL